MLHSIFRVVLVLVALPSGKSSQAGLRRQGNDQGFSLSSSLNIDRLGSPSRRLGMKKSMKRTEMKKMSSNAFVQENLGKTQKHGMSKKMKKNRSNKCGKQGMTGICKDPDQCTDDSNIILALAGCPGGDDIKCCANKIADGLPCPSSQSSHCQSGLCSYADAGQDALLICCSSGKAGYIGDGSKTVCAGREAGKWCDEDRGCDSGICSAFVCLPGPIADGLPCPNSNDLHCRSKVCSHADAGQDAPLICCPSGASEWTADGSKTVCLESSHPGTTPGTAVATTSATTLIPFSVKCFAENEELRSAVKNYTNDPSPESFVAAIYGWPIGKWCVSEVQDMKLVIGEGFNEDISNWNVSSVKNMNLMFSGATSFNQPLSNWDVSSVEFMSSMFKGATSFNQPLSNWNVSSVKFMFHMFEGATSFNQLLSNWDVSSVTNMEGMFQGATSFNQPLSNWDVSSVELMSQMFYGATSFNQPLSNWDVSSVINMNFMFSNTKIFNQPLSNWNTSSVINMPSMFSGAASFNQPLSNWNTSSVTTMSWMFSSATSFNQPLSNWDISSVTTMVAIFSGARSFKQDLCKWGLKLVDYDESFFMLGDTRCLVKRDPVIDDVPTGGPLCSACA
mmetsp:Transcript_18736/g.37573  ORF Transcript_18736/g.37573 Transcript_18736/m.37573 type:complete len:619 (+) Transcript_18736:512-2368(+)